MIAVDTSSLSAYFAGEAGPDIDLIDKHVAAGTLQLPPVALTEALSAPNITIEATELLAMIPMLRMADGYWERAGQSRRLIRSKGLRARLGDALIAQTCIDNDAALITRDSDFRHYAAHCGLKLA